MSIAKKFEVIADEVYEKGKKDEYDKFWDEYQSSKYGIGKRKEYSSGFAFGWSFENFYPKYDIKPEGDCSKLFYGWSDSKNQTRYSLKKRLEECGVELDTSKATIMNSFFGWNTLITEAPTLNLTGLTSNPTGMFSSCGSDLKTVSFIVDEDTPMGSWFGGTTGVENLTIEGTIGKSGFKVSSLTELTKESLLSILTALSKDSSIASGKSVTFSTVHQSVIEANADCLEQLNLAISAGWTIAYA